MAIGGLGGGLLAGLSGIAQGLKEAQQQREQQQLMQMRQAQLRRINEEDAASSGLFGSILGGLGDVSGGTALTNPMMAGPQAPMPGQGSTAYSPTPQGSGMSSGLARGGPISDPLDLIDNTESGHRNIMQQVVGPSGGYNPSVGRVTGPSSAGGYFQMIDPTWRGAARLAGVDTNLYPRAIDAPYAVQRQVAGALLNKEGFGPWAPYNANLRARLARGEGRGGISSGEPQQPPETMLRGGGAPSVAPPGAGGMEVDPDAIGRDVDAAQAEIDARSSGGASSAGEGGYTGMSKPGRAYIPFMGGDIPAGSGGTGQAASPRPSGGPGAVSETGIALPGDGQRPAAPQARQQAPAAAMPSLMATAPPPVQQRVQQGAVQTAQAIPQAAWGRMSLPALAQQIEKNNPGASGVVKMMMLEKAQKLMAPTELRSWEIYKMQHQDAIHVADQAFQRETAILAEERAERTRQQSQQFQIEQQQRGFTHTDANKENQGYTLLQPPAGSNQPSMWVKPGAPSIPVEAPAGYGKSAASTMQPEIQFPDKWDGMPDKAPPGVRQDIWQASMEYVRTGKMPSLGFQAGPRGMILQASPAAAHALGMPASKVADYQAAYAGERHGMIVGGGRAATIELGISEALKAAPQVVETSKAVPRTEFPPLNQLNNWLAEKTGDPNIVAFKEALNTYLNVYASTVSRTGRLTDAQQRHAYELLSTAFTQGQIERGIQQLDYEMQLMREAVPEAMQSIEKIGQPPALRAPSAPAPTPQQQNAPETKPVPPEAAGLPDGPITDDTTGETWDKKGNTMTKRRR